MKKLRINSTLCTGCLNCQTVCALGRRGIHSKSASAIKVNLEVFSGLHSHVYCRQCKDAECERACPVNAIFRDSGTNALRIDTDVCVGCKLCVDACTYKAMFWDAEVGLPFKCDLCNGNPRCKEACKFNAIDFTGGLK